MRATMQITAMTSSATNIDASTPRWRSVIHEGVDLLGKVEVHLGQAAFGLGAEDHAHLVVADVDVRMMVGLLGELRHAVHEVDSLREVFELERAFDVLAFNFPSGEVFERFLDLLVVVESRHGSGA